MARVLLTGATGFLGGAVLARLRQRGHEVVSLGRSAPTGLGAAEHLAADFGDPSSLLRHREALRGVELVAHLGGAVLRSGGRPAVGGPVPAAPPAAPGSSAASDPTAAPDTAADAAQTLRVNAEGTAHLLSILPAGLAGFCYASTLDVYGPGEPLLPPAPASCAPDRPGASPPPPPSFLPLTEDRPARPATPYAASKLAAEALLGAWSAGAGVPVAILRLSHLYGPGDTSAKAIPAFLAACRRGARPVVRGGADVRDYLYIEDAAAAVTRALEQRAAGILNIAAGHGTSIRDLLTAVQAAARTFAAADWQPAQNPPTALVLDVTRARAVLGWQPRIGLAEGLRRTVATRAAVATVATVATMGADSAGIEARDRARPESGALMMKTPFLIESARLLIRPWEPADDAGFRAMVSDPEMMRYISGGQPWAEPRIAEFFARQQRHLAAHGCCMGALLDRRSGRLAGVCGLQPLGKTSDFEAGWWVVRDLWGRGLATEAGAAALRFGWEILGLPRIKAIAMPGNRGSIRVMEKLGMTFERQATGHDLGLAAPDVNVVVYAIERPPR